jgi:hypothetical protein
MFAPGLRTAAGSRGLAAEGRADKGYSTAEGTGGVKARDAGVPTGSAALPLPGGKSARNRKGWHVGSVNIRRSRPREVCVDPDTIVTGNGSVRGPRRADAVLCSLPRWRTEPRQAVAPAHGTKSDTKRETATMTEAEYGRKLDELDRLINDPEVPIQPDRVWSLLAEIATREHAAGAPRRTADRKRNH